MEVIDVYNEKPEDKTKSSKVKWVPHIEHQDKEITIPEFETLIGRR